MFCLISVGGKFMGVGISVAHNTFIGFDLVKISNFIVIALPWIFIQIIRRKKSILISTLEITMQHFK